MERRRVCSRRAASERAAVAAVVVVDRVAAADRPLLELLKPIGHYLPENSRFNYRA
jgi:hypothetical protein